MNHEKTISRQRERRAFRVRKRVRGTAQRPRLSVFRSHQHIYAQVIDDSAGRTLATASTVDKDLRSDIKYGGNKSAAQTVGKAIAERAAWDFIASEGSGLELSVVNPVGVFGPVLGAD